MCSIGDGCYVGIGATVVDRITIGAGSVIGAAALVTKNIAPNVEVRGVPARVVKEGVESR